MTRITSKDWPPFLAVTSTKVVLVSGRLQYTLYQSGNLLYGLTWDHDSLYVSTRHDPEEKGQSSILKFNRGMKLVGQLPVKKLGRDVHQLFYWDGRLYICNTDEACIVAYNLEADKQSEIRWTTDDIHLNCMWKFGSVFYALEHKHNNSPKNIKLFDLTWQPIAIMPVHTGIQTKEYGFGIHNIFVLGGTYITLGPSLIYKVDVDTGEPVTTTQRLDDIVAGRDYLRGLAVLPGKYMLIGSSGTAPRAHRGLGSARVLLVDLKFNVLDEIVLHDVGQVCSIRLLRNDIAHNNMPCPYQPDWR